MIKPIKAKQTTDSVPITFRILIKVLVIGYSLPHSLRLRPRHFSIAKTLLAFACHETLHTNKLLSGIL
jgi:hypothetical protein